MLVSSAEGLAAVVRARRKDLGLTQIELSDAAGISTRAIFDLENGKASVTFKNLLTILNVLGLELDIEVRANG